MRQIQRVRSKNELVYESLLSAIVQGELPPGERLVIDELANELGVSQIPVREAMRQLEADGFITIQPHVGATVTDIQTSLITEVFGLLESMEVVSGLAACEYLTDDDFDVLEKHLRLMDSLVGDPDSWSQANVQFHQLVCDRAGTELVKKMMDKVLAHWDRLRGYYQLRDVFIQRLEEAHEQHWAMFEAMRSRDRDSLARIVHEHNQAALEEYRQHLKEPQKN